MPLAVRTPTADQWHEGEGWRLSSFNRMVARHHREHEKQFTLSLIKYSVHTRRL